jgi:uncharacterized protein (TIGR00730 family)
VKRLCVFCGSSTGVDPVHADAARALAIELVSRGIGVVYGGGAIGLMGVVADAALAAGGEVIGVIPRPLASRELAHTGLTEMRFVRSMHERKATMSALADGFVTLPGGLGTFEETFEIMTWAHLGIHRKPVGLLNVRGYYDGLLRMLAHAMREGFMRREFLGLISVSDAAADLLDAMAAWTPPALPRAWLDPSQA